MRRVPRRLAVPLLALAAVALLLAACGDDDVLDASTPEAADLVAWLLGRRSEAARASASVGTERWWTPL